MISVIFGYFWGFFGWFLANSFLPQSSCFIPPFILDRGFAKNIDSGPIYSNTLPLYFCTDDLSWWVISQLGSHVYKSVTHSFGSDIHLLLPVNACPKRHRFTHRFTENTTYVLLFTLIFITLETFPIFIYTSSLFITHLSTPLHSKAFITCLSPNYFLLWALCFGLYPRLRALLILFPVVLIGSKAYAILSDSEHQRYQSSTVRESDYAESSFLTLPNLCCYSRHQILATQDSKAQTALASRPVLHRITKKKQDLRVLEAPGISTLRMNPCKLLSFPFPVHSVMRLIQH